MSSITGSSALADRMESLALAPVEHPDILPSVLPLLLGLVIIELYFGKHKDEELGWNSSVANAVIWLATGATLLVSGEITRSVERYAAYFLVTAGSITAYMNFYHKWRSGVAFMVSSSALVYTIAYVTVVMVKTPVPADSTGLKAAAFFVALVTVGFKIIQGLEKPSRPVFR